MDHYTVRGQYAPGVSEGRSVAGYAEEGGKASQTETFVALRADIANWRWAGTPFFLRTGKRMPERRTEIVIQFKDAPHSIFQGVAGADLQPNQLIIRLQPQEEVSLRIMNKAPGLTEDGMNLRPLNLNLSLTEAFGQAEPRRRIAYERLILDALHANSTLFVRRDEVEAAWTWIDPIINAWKASGTSPKLYASGSWGPSGVFALMERMGRSWNE
jgi:glucose-6-phosphate 1-dehydrogenase